MRILIDNGTYHLTNLGDVAMLQTAVARLGHLFPGARMRVITHAPRLLQQHCPDASPISPLGRDHWFDAGIAMGALKRRLPAVAHAFAHQAEQSIKYASPRLIVNWRKLRDSDSGQSAAMMNEFLSTVAASDLVIASGGGYLTDEFLVSSRRLLGTLRLARSMGKATALFGQGIGPVQLPAMREALRAGLAGVTAVGIRETRRGPMILKNAGVPDRVVHSTGDDAIEMAIQQTPGERGRWIGLNLRCVADKESKDDTDDARLPVTKLVKQFAIEKQALIAPAPISHRIGDDDTEIAEDFINRTNAPTVPGLTDPRTSDAVIQRISQCRLVITGSYHAAVFPCHSQWESHAIALARMDYYKDKFLGLFEQFESSEAVVLLDSPDWQRTLNEQLAKAWNQSDGERAKLRNLAAKQADRGRRFYEKVAESLTRTNSAVLSGSD